MENICSFDAGEVFSGKKSGKSVMGWATPNEYTPDVNPDYILPAWSNDIIVWLLYCNEPLWIYGPMGCGKTSAVKNIIARLNYPVYEITGHGRLELSDIIGHHTVINGTMSYTYGPLGLAMKYGGLLLFNELDLVPPDTFAGMNTILDGAPLCVAENGGEIVRKHPMFRFAATSNTNGMGDDTGLYQGTLRMNLAALDRFLMVQASYLDTRTELKLLRKTCPALPETVCERMLTYVDTVRKLFIGELDSDISTMDVAIEATFSTRCLLRWGKLIDIYSPLQKKNVDVVAYALDRALGFKVSKSTQIVLRELLQRIFGSKTEEEN